MYTVLIDGIHTNEAFFNPKAAIDAAIKIIVEGNRQIKESISVRDFSVVDFKSDIFEINYGKFYFVVDYAGKGFGVREEI